MSYDPVDLERAKNLAIAIDKGLMTVEECLPHLPDTHGRMLLAVIGHKYILNSQLAYQVSRYNTSGSQIVRSLCKYASKTLVEYASRCHILNDEETKQTLKWVEEEMP